MWLHPWSLKNPSCMLFLQVGGGNFVTYCLYQARSLSTLHFSFSPISSVFLCPEYERRSLCFTTQSTITGTTELQPSSTTASTVLSGGVHQHCYHHNQHVLQPPGQISQPGYLPLLSLDRVLVPRGMRNRMVPTKSSH